MPYYYNTLCTLTAHWRWFTVTLSYSSSN